MQMMIVAVSVSRYNDPATYGGSCTLGYFNIMTAYQTVSYKTTLMHIVIINSAIPGRWGRLVVMVWVACDSRSGFKSELSSIVCECWTIYRSWLP